MAFGGQRVGRGCRPRKPSVLVDPLSLFSSLDRVLKVQSNFEMLIARSRAAGARRRGGRPLLLLSNEALSLLVALLLVAALASGVGASSDDERCSAVDLGVSEGHGCVVKCLECQSNCTHGYQRFWCSHAGNAVRSTTCDCRGGEGSNLGLIIGLAVGGTVGMGCIIGATVALTLKYQKSKSMPPRAAMWAEDSGPIAAESELVVAEFKAPP